VHSHWIESPHALAALVHEWQEPLQKDPRLALDTEFIRERTYRPVLEIIQLALSTGEIALLDVPKIGTLEPLYGLLHGQEVLKLLHSGGQDVEILTEHTGKMPWPIFDTQVAAAFAGHPLQLGYGALVQSRLHVHLSKEEGFSDWSRRPITNEMRDYAENDVRYLHTLHTQISESLTARGRTAWANEQMERTLTHAATFAPPEDIWQSVQGRGSLQGKELAVLRELAIWRDEEAKRRNKPRRSVLKDDLLVEVAKRKPRTVDKILEMRVAPPNLGERVAAQLVEAVTRGSHAPAELWPQTERRVHLDEPAQALYELLSAAVRSLAATNDIPASLLASGDDLKALAATARCNGPLFEGWRGAIVGEALEALIKGKNALRWDAKGRRLIQEG
jgi:ribonuclease D